MYMHSGPKDETTAGSDRDDVEYIWSAVSPDGVLGK